MTDVLSVKVKITGRVQGVCFRAETRNAARNIGLKGYVRNLADGSVEALFQGSPADVEEMLKWCRKGAPASRVDQVIRESVPSQDDLTGFEIRY